MEYPCELSETGECKYGGGKRFNWGFASGTRSFCRHPKEKRFLSGPLHEIDCPLKAKELD